VRTSDEMEGWAAASVLNTDQPVENVYEATPAPTPTPTPLPEVNGTIVSRANLRVRPVPDGAVAAELEEGTQAAGLAQTSDSNWLLIRTADGLECWVFESVRELDQPQELVPLYNPTPIPSPTLDPSVTPPTPVPPTGTPVPTPLPGTIPTPAQFNPFRLRDSARNMDQHIVNMGGLLDKMAASGTTQEDCDQFQLDFDLVKSSALYENPPPVWRGPYVLYLAAQQEVLDNMSSILAACDELGDITELNYSLARDPINVAHDWLVSSITQLTDLLGDGG